MNNLPQYLPILILLLAALLTGVVGLLPARRRWAGVAAVLGVAVALVAVFFVGGASGDFRWIAAIGGDVTLGLGGDALSQPFVLVTLVLGGLALLGNLGRRDERDGGFYPLILLLLAALLTIYLAAGFFLAMLGWTLAAAIGWLLLVNERAVRESQARAIGAPLGGLLLLGAAAYLSRLNGGQVDYASIVPATVVAAAPLALLLAGVLVGASQYPLMWAVSDEHRPHWATRAIVFGLGLGLPELYLVLRAERIAAGGGLLLPDWWYLALQIIGGLTAVLGAFFALRGQTASDVFAGLATAGTGLCFWAISLHTPSATAAALLLGMGLAVGRVTLASGLAGQVKVTVALGALTLALLPPFAGFVGLWLLVSAALETGNRVGLFIIALTLLASLPAAGALLTEARKLSEGARPRRFPAVGPLLAGIGLAACSLALSLAAPLLDALVPPALAPLLAIGAREEASFSISATMGDWPVLGVAVVLGLGLLLWLALSLRAKREDTTIAEAEGMGAADVVAPLGEYLRPIGWLQPRIWASVLGLTGNATENALVRLDRVLEGRYYILFTVLLMLVALLVISR